MSYSIKVTCLCVGLYLSITSIYYCHTTGINKGTISLLFEGISTAVVKVCRKYFGVKKFAEHSMHWLQIFPDHSLRRKAATGSCFKIWTRYMFLQPPLSDDGVSFMLVFLFFVFWLVVGGGPRGFSSQSASCARTYFTRDKSVHFLNCGNKPRATILRGGQ